MSSSPPPLVNNPPSTTISQEQPTQSSSPHPSSSSSPTTISQEQQTGAPSSSTTTNIITLTSQEQQQQQDPHPSSSSSPTTISQEQQTGAPSSSTTTNIITLTSPEQQQQQQQDPQQIIRIENPQHQNWWQRTRPYAIVILLQFLFAIMNFTTKLAMNNGMSNYVFVAYRNIPACLVFAPFAVYRERDRWSQMTWSVFRKILALSVLGPIMDQDLYFLGMKYSTATLASALGNTLPGMSFILACVTGRETINITAKPSQAKILGTIISVLGALVMTLVKGPVLFGTVGADSHSHHHNGFHTILGVVFILLSTLSNAASNILQTITLEELNLPLTVTSLMLLFGSIEAILVAVLMNKTTYYSVWYVFQWDIKLLTAIYAGIFCSGLGFYLRGQVMQARGPVFGTMFNPVCMILVAMSGYFFLDEQQFLGRVIGALIICSGLYFVVWGTNKDNILRRQAQENANANAVANP
ncbi:WAT1-related protein At2g37460-like [Trifolium pratense]|uniref:WAT1-related protein At2g37460-like n=1 Tax=Trifolium pratense TaxID=57577 RepID=UPI001E696B62|nr:WAT1-related protein At2g37460-like [Trifolium pratense]